MTRIFARPSLSNEESKSFSQSGEDVIVDFLSKMLGIYPLRYLDLGANDPIKFNNTYKFYLDGCSGVLVEPDGELVKTITKKRPRDVCLAKAVSVFDGDRVQFFKMTENTLSTIKKDTVCRYQAETEHQLLDSLTVPAVHINQILEEFHPRFKFNFVSLDVEGLDLDILLAWDFSRWRPEVFCVETLTYTQKGSAEKIEEIFDRMKQVGYYLYADTYINSIFVDGNKFTPAQRHM